MTGTDAGGFAGTVDTAPGHDPITVNRVYASGQVSGTNTSGGLIGNFVPQDYQNVSLSTTYWDVNTTNQSSSSGTITWGDTVGLQTADMTGSSAETSMGGFDFIGTWRTVDSSYPELRWNQPVWNDLTISADSNLLIVGETTEITVSAISETGIVDDVTDEATISVANTSVLTYTDGSIMATGAGDTTLSADYESLEESISVTVLSEGIDALPESYNGTLTVNNQSAPVGTTVEGLIGGEVRGSVNVTTAGTYGSQDLFEEQLLVSGTAGESGATVQFRVVPPNGSNLVPGMATETSLFSPDNTTTLNLTAQLETPAPPVYNLVIPTDGSAYSIGIPGPANVTLAELFPSGSDGLDTAYTHTDSGWQQIYNGSQTFDPLDAIVVTTTEDPGAPSSVPVTVRLANNTAAPNRTLQTGWNYLAAPAYTTLEDAFGVPGVLLAHQRFESPGTTVHPSTDGEGTYIIGSVDWGVTPPAVSPFAGTFVYAENETAVPVRAQKFPYKQAADDKLGLP
ncbi:MAG: hypothetical protein U5K37_08395 [Natrialbaceae archaeon]|nr:hypothetical protein [Natrialbaceae archaeon]